MKSLTVKSMKAGSTIKKTEKCVRELDSFPFEDLNSAVDELAWCASPGFNGVSPRTLKSPYENIEECY